MNEKESKMMEMEYLKKKIIIHKNLPPLCLNNLLREAKLKMAFKYTFLCLVDPSLWLEDSITWKESCPHHTTHHHHTITAPRQTPPHQNHTTTHHTTTTTPQDWMLPEAAKMRPTRLRNSIKFFLVTKKKQKLNANFKCKFFNKSKISGKNCIHFFSLDPQKSFKMRGFRVRGGGGRGATKTRSQAVYLNVIFNSASPPQGFFVQAERRESSVSSIIQWCSSCHSRPGSCWVTGRGHSSPKWGWAKPFPWVKMHRVGPELKCIIYLTFLWELRKMNVSVS